MKNRNSSHHRLSRVCSRDIRGLVFERDMLKAVFASMGDGVYYTDPERRILAWNRVAGEITGYSSEEVEGKFCRDILNDTDMGGKALCDISCPLLNAALRPEATCTDDVWLRRKDGRRIPVEVSTSCVRDESGTLLGMVEVFRDRTKHWELERMKEEFVATITHDLKSPITSMMGFCGLLADKRSGELSEKKLDYVRMIRQASNLLLTLINNIVDTSRIQAGQMSYAFENFPLDALLMELRETFESQPLRNNITLDFSCSAGTWLYADRGKIAQVFHNLLSNAFRYTPSGGKISIEATKGEGVVHLKVADTGRGIPKDEQGKLFQKFVQVKGERRGTGLGLYIVKNILAGHDSEIRLESDVGKGTSFLFAIKEGSASREISFRSGNLLLVAEDSESARMVRLVLEKEGHGVDLARNGLEALQKMGQSRPDLLIVQHPLPDLTVDDFLCGLNAIPDAKKIPVALLSAVRIPEWEKRLTFVISMPINVRNLKASVRKILAA